MAYQLARRFLPNEAAGVIINTASIAGDDRANDTACG